MREEQERGVKERAREEKEGGEREHEQVLGG